MGGPSIDYKMSHQQNWLFTQLQPYVKRMMSERHGLWKVPNAVLPNKKWWNNMSPNVKEGLWAPWEESAERMKEVMGSKGQVGSMSPNVGHTGSYADASGRLFSEAGKNVGMQAWQMSYPGLSAKWQGKLQKRMAPMSMLGQMPSTMPTGFVGPNDWQTAFGGVGAIAELASALNPKGGGGGGGGGMMGGGKGGGGGVG